MVDNRNSGVLLKVLDKLVKCSGFAKNCISCAR